MLELAGRSGFHGCARHRVFRPGLPGHLDRAGLFDSLGGDVWVVGVIATRSASRIGPPFCAPQANRASQRFRRSARPRPHHHGRPVTPRRARNSLIEHRLSPITLLGEEPHLSEELSRGLVAWAVRQGVQAGPRSKAGAGVSIGEVAPPLAVKPNVLHRRQREFRRGPGYAFPGNGPGWSEGRIAEPERNVG